MPSVRSPLLATNKSPEDVASTVGFSELPMTALIDKTTKSTRYGCGIADSSLYLGCKLFDSLPIPRRAERQKTETQAVYNVFPPKVLNCIAGSVRLRSCR